MGVLLVPGSGSWAMAVTFRERTLEEEQADSAKDRRGLALPGLSACCGVLTVTVGKNKAGLLSGFLLTRTPFSSTRLSPEG